MAGSSAIRTLREHAALATVKREACGTKQKRLPWSAAQPGLELAQTGPGAVAADPRKIPLEPSQIFAEPPKITDRAPHFSVILIQGPPQGGIYVF